VRLLLDENLSPRLVTRLLSLFPGLSHVRDVGLRQANDMSIWEWAKENDYTVVTADSDFVAMTQPLTDSVIDTVAAQLRPESGSLYSGMVCEACGRSSAHF
jgi:predicted nuclease of predicted toxin-antitoxin system